PSADSAPRRPAATPPAATRPVSSWLISPRKNECAEYTSHTAGLRHSHFPRNCELMLCRGRSQQAGPLVLRQHTRCTPEHVPLPIDEQRHHLLRIRDVELLPELLAIHEQRHDPVPHHRIGLIAAHRRGLPPAKDKVLFPVHRQLVITKSEIRVLDSLRYRKPAVHVVLLLRLEGDDQQIN